METLLDINEHMPRAALEYLRLGYRPIKLRPGTKEAAVKWKRFQTQAPTEAELSDWFSDGDAGIALVTGNGVVVVDCDSPEMVNLVIEHCGDTPMRSATPTPGHMHLWYGMRKGVHYGNAVKIKGKPIDLRCEGAYAVVPWSRVHGVAYQWLGPVLPADQLPLLKVSWLRERKRSVQLQPIEPSANVELMVRRARAYLAHVEGAVSGQRGHDQTMRAAGILIQKFRLSIAQAWPLLLEWNQHCEPPWDEKTLLRKLREAERLTAQRGLRPIS